MLDNALVSLRPRDLLPVVIQHDHISSVIRPSERNDLVLPMSLLSQQFIDLVIQVSHFIVRETS